MASFEATGPVWASSALSFGSKPDAEDTHGSTNVFDAVFAEVLELIIHSVAQVFAHVPRHTDATRLSDRLQTRGNVDAIAEDAAILDITSPTRG